MLRHATTGPPSPRPRRALPPRTVPWEPVAMVLVAFALRALYAWLAQGQHAVPTHDEANYDALAWNLARGAGYVLPGVAGPAPTALLPPVLPFVTGLLYRITGHDLFAALLLQCAAGALVPVVLAGFARATWGSVVARVAGWLAAVHPLLVLSCGRLVPEPLFTLLTLLALWASADWVKTPRPGRALGTGLLWGAAVLTRPDGITMPLLIAAWSWFPLGLTLNGRDRVRQAALLLLGVVLAVGPWTLRNARALHAFVPVATGGGTPADPWLRAAFPFAPLSASSGAWLAWYLLVGPLALHGAFVMLASPKRLFLSLALLATAAFVAATVVQTGSLRPCVSVEPLVVLHAAVGVDAVWKRWRRRRGGLQIVPRRD